MSLGKLIVTGQFILWPLRLRNDWVKHPTEANNPFGILFGGFSYCISINWKPPKTISTGRVSDSFGKGREMILILISSTNILSVQPKIMDFISPEVRIELSWIIQNLKTRTSQRHCSWPLNLGLFGRSSNVGVSLPTQNTSINQIIG